MKDCVKMIFFKEVNTMTNEVFLSLLLLISILVSLTTEAVKKSLPDTMNVPSNILAIVCSITLSIVVGVFFCILNSIPFSASVIIYIISLVFLSWLCAMLGYDKVMQAFKQFVE